MELEYTTQGRFVPEVNKLIEELKADAVMLIVFGSNIKGSGCCCQIQAPEPEFVAQQMVEHLRELADSIELEIETGQLPNDNDEHKQTFN